MYPTSNYQKCSYANALNKVLRPAPCSYDCALFAYFGLKKKFLVQIFLHMASCYIAAHVLHTAHTCLPLPKVEGDAEHAIRMTQASCVLRVKKVRMQKLNRPSNPKANPDVLLSEEHQSMNAAPSPAPFFLIGPTEAGERREY